MKINVLLVFIWISFDCSSQNITLQTSMSKIDSIFKGNEIVEGYPKYKHIVRDAYWWSSRVNSDGSFNNVKKLNEKALRGLEKDNPDLSNSRSTNSDWEFIGPNLSTYASDASYCKGNGYGRVDRVSFHPTDANKIYVTTPNGGAWYSPNKGDTWEPLTDNLPFIGCAGIEVDKNNSNILYALTGSSDHLSTSLDLYRYQTYGIFKSLDHGQNWEKVLNFDTLYVPIIFNLTETDTIPLQDIRAHRLKISPLSPNEIYAATSHGMARSNDFGNSWFWTDPFFHYTDIEFHPTNQNIVYGSGIGFIRRSTDAGISWSQSTGYSGCCEESCTSKRIEIAVSPDSPNSVWGIKGGSVNANNTCGYIKSENSGLSFSVTGYSPNLVKKEDGTGADQTHYDLAISVDPENDQRVFIGGLTMFRNESYDNEDNTDWENVATFWEDTGNQQGSLPSNYLHPDVHDIAYNPLDETLYACSDGGLYLSNDNGDSWVNKSSGINSSMFYNINLGPNDEVIGGLQDNGIKIKESTSLNFTHIFQADGYDSDLDKNDDERLLFSINTSLYLLSDYNSNTENDLYLTGGSPNWFIPSRFNSGNSNVVYAGRKPMETIFISSDDMSKTITTSSSTNASGSWKIETCDQMSTQIYIAGGDNSFFNDSGGSFHTSLNGGDVFIDRSSVTGFPSEMIKITDIAVDPNNCYNVAFSHGGYIDGSKIYYSAHSGGVNWTNLTYNLPNVPVNALEIDNSGYIYAGTDLGVYFLKTGTTVWLPYNNNLPRITITGIELNSTGEKIIASTFGRGVWQSNVAEECSITTPITVDDTGNEFYEASVDVNSTSQITGGIGTNVDYHAGEKIKLLPGFGVTKFSIFTGAIKPCGTSPE